MQQEHCKPFISTGEGGEQCKECHFRTKGAGAGTNVFGAGLFYLVRTYSANWRKCRTTPAIAKTTQHSAEERRGSSQIRYRLIQSTLCPVQSYQECTQCDEYGNEECGGRRQVVGSGSIEDNECDEGYAGSHRKAHPFGRRLHKGFQWIEHSHAASIARNAYIGELPATILHSDFQQRAYLRG